MITTVRFPYIEHGDLKIAVEEGGGPYRIMAYSHMRVAPLHLLNVQRTTHLICPSVDVVNILEDLLRIGRGS